FVRRNRKTIQLYYVSKTFATKSTSANVRPTTSLPYTFRGK
ncbi:22747_t:CDS:1, partial [Gigaspora rosea]